MRVLRLCIILFLLSCSGARGLLGESREGELKALIIGNSRYENAGTFQDLRATPERDAEAIGAVLVDSGFAAKANVTVRENLTRDGLINALYEFRARLKPDDSAFIYFSGHGFSIDGESFLAPVDLKEGKHGGIAKKDAVALHTLIDFTSNVSVRAIILDACRTTMPILKKPLPPNQRNTISALGTIRNVGSLIAYSTSGGAPSRLDSPGQGLSYFTYFLVGALRSNPADLNFALVQAKNGTVQASKKSQIPEINDALAGMFLLSNAADEGSRKAPLAQLSFTPPDPIVEKVDEDVPMLCPAAGKLYLGWRITGTSVSKPHWSISPSVAYSASHSTMGDTAGIPMNHDLQREMYNRLVPPADITNSMQPEFQSLIEEISNLLPKAGTLDTPNGKTPTENRLTDVIYKVSNNTLRALYIRTSVLTNQIVGGDMEGKRAYDIQVTNITLDGQRFMKRLGISESERSDQLCKDALGSFTIPK